MSQQGKETRGCEDWACTRFKLSLQGGWRDANFFFFPNLFCSCVLFPSFPPPSSMRNNFKLSCTKKRNKLSIPDYTLFRAWNNLTSLWFGKSPFDPSILRKKKGISFDWLDEQELLSITRATISFINPETALARLLLGHLENDVKVAVNPLHHYFPTPATSGMLMAFANC